MTSFLSRALRTSFLAGAGSLLAAGSAVCDDTPAGNLATAENGAYIVYSTPLKGGDSANFLTQDHNHHLHFQHGGPMLFVLDLGKTYALGSVGLKFKNSVKVEVYVLSAKPENGNWQSVLSGQPDFVSDTVNLEEVLKGQEGRYLVFVAESDPGPFYNLYVTGIYVRHPDNEGPFFGFFAPPPHDDDQGGDGPPGEQPRPKGMYPPVQNPSQ